MRYRIVYYPKGKATFPVGCPRKVASSHDACCVRAASYFSSESIAPIRSFVEEQIQRGQIRKDPEQLDLADRLDLLRADLARTDSQILPSDRLTVDLFSDAVPKGLVASAKQRYLALASAMRFPLWSSTRNPRGIYIHGSVGVGKSFLMDLFAGTARSAADSRGVKRAHFHEFMLDVHDRIHHFKKRHPRSDPLPSVALSLAQEARLLCLDEFQVTDIADAMILKRLFTMLWMETNPSARGIGMVLVATSNRDPNVLYEGGLNRASFLPFIATLQRHMDVVQMTGNRDYRREGDSSDATTRSYFWPADSHDTRRALAEIFASGGGTEHTDHDLPVRMNRHVRVPRGNDRCAWFDFSDLCDRPLGAADYLSLCQRYPVLMVDNVPQLDASRFNEARRFVTLVDALYETRTRLVLASQVRREDLLVHFDATVESQDGDEEMAMAGSREQPNAATVEMFVKGEGGSSSSASTTMIRSKGGEVEWSATGRIGVSLAQLSAVRDVSFSFQRAESRLVEMNNGTWGRH